MKPTTLLVACALLAALPAAADTVQIEAGRDATMIEDPDGAWANGSGPFLFVGRNAGTQNGIRRGLIYFDVSALPPHARIESVTLRLYEAGGNAGTREMTLHRVQAAWGEGPSSASGGGGAPAGPGDATWIHAVYDDEFWVHAGGQFVGRASASREVDAGGFYTFESNEHLVQDVRLWLANPRRNLGWIVIGDEASLQNAKKFATRESLDPSIRPQLTITYR